MTVLYVLNISVDFCFSTSLNNWINHQLIMSVCDSILYVCRKYHWTFVDLCSSTVWSWFIMFDYIISGLFAVCNASQLFIWIKSKHTVYWFPIYTTIHFKVIPTVNTSDKTNDTIIIQDIKEDKIISTSPSKLQKHEVSKKEKLGEPPNSNINVNGVSHEVSNNRWLFNALCLLLLLFSIFVSLFLE